MARRRGASGIPLFRVFGIQIRVDWSWLIIFFVMVSILRQYFGPTLKNQPDWAVWLLSAVSVIALFGCVLAHELGHSVVAMRHGIQMFDITLFIFGGMARLRGEPRTPNDELKIALAGPAVTVLLAGAFWAAWTLLQTRLHVVISEGVRYLAVVNTALLVFNMFPGFPLDGGRVLRAVLWKIRGNLLSATQTAAAVGKGFGLMLIGLGLLDMYWQVQASGGISFGAIVPGLFYVFLGWFLATAARQSVQHLQVRRVLEMFRVADAMQRNVVAVGRDMPLDRLVADGFSRHQFKSFPVLWGDEFRGLVSLPDVQRVPPVDWPATTAGQVTPPESANWRIAPDDGLYEAFRRMSEDDIGRLAVTDPAGRVVGMICRRDILHLLGVQSQWPADMMVPPRQAIPVAEPVADEQPAAQANHPGR